MPRNSGGVYTAPIGTLGVPVTPISSTAYDAFVADLSTALTNSVNTSGTAPMLANLNMGNFKIINHVTPQVATDVANKFYVDSVVPPGMIMAYAKNVAPPSGWLICNGASVSTTSFATLFAVIGYTYGGAGVTFTLPDFRGCFLRGFDNSRGLDYQGTRAVNAFQNTALANHFHTVTDPGHIHGVSDPSHNHSQSAHGHGVIDPTHAHNIPGQQAGTNFTAGVGFNLGATTTTANAPTGITIQPQVANLNAAFTGISISAAFTGISVTNVSSGTIVANETVPKNYPILWCIKF